ncbi:hypothetical protein PQ462_10935 [Flavobacterium sp. KACC 22758]|uniref:RHS repeat domain-containing protein n=1 Tax=Flavobacterium sp. KACC 22758 TaxID=3025667 RepID=UPI002364FEA4|nr:hypothetical protein [Flavobacterium sp. KACC 22758]WDF61881.1 hypothetical protein PQ462_10935 [Flavobacterium sp. KACC 22758]
MKFIAFFCCLISLIVKAQNTNIFPASPNASSLIEYVNLPVSLDTGIPTISYPLLSIKNNDIEVPISVSYHAAGIKVNEVPSWAGTGWTLNSGGVISRVIAGMPDDVDNGFIGLNQKGKLVNQNWDAVYIRSANNRVVDTEPDIFYFNFLNFQGKFVFTADGDIVMLPHQDLKIQPPLGPKKVDNYWTIIDGQGNKYKFGTTPASIEKIGITTTFNTGGNIDTVTAAPRVSSWYLCEIESATGDKITFEYKSGSPYSFESKSESRTAKYFPGNPVINSVQFITVTNTVTNPVYLDKIVSANGYVKFNSLSLREDLINSYKIDNIQLINKNASVVRKINFNHSYFASPGCTSPDCKRLKLDGISQESSLATQQLYQFQYNQNVLLPSRMSPQIDHWGYFNQNGETILNTGNALNRAPNFEGTKANILQKITYPTGGSISFDFELNDFDASGANSPTGGLRISRITENFKYGGAVARDYIYRKGNSASSSGTSYATPKYTSDGVVISDGHNWSFYKMSSHSLRQLFDLNGSNVKYEEVKVRYPDNSSEINFFTSFLTNPDIRNQIDYRRYRTDINTLYSVLDINPFEEPFSPPSVNNFNERGFLTKKIYKNSLDKTVYTLENTYKKINPSGQYQSYGFSISQFAANSSGTEQVFNIGKYTFKNDIYVLDKTREVKYDLNNLTAGTEINTEYSYSAEFPTLKTTEVMTNSDGKKHKSVYKYCFDILNENGMAVLKQKNNIMLAVLESRFVDDIDIYNKKIYFDTAAGYLNNGGMPLVREVKENKTSDKNNNIVFEKYDMEGRLLQFKQADNVSTSVIWGYNNEYPIAKLENIAYNEIPSDLIAQLKTKSNGFIQSELMDAFTNLRNSPVLNKGLITTYTYAPLIGVTSITDPKGYTTYYEYDEFNRLRSSRDAAGNIIAEKKYNYKQ